MACLHLTTKRRPGTAAVGPAQRRSARRPEFWSFLLRRSAPRTAAETTFPDVNTTKTPGSPTARREADGGRWSAGGGRRAEPRKAGAAHADLASAGRRHVPRRVDRAVAVAHVAGVADHLDVPAGRPQLVGYGRGSDRPLGVDHHVRGRRGVLALRAGPLHAGLGDAGDLHVAPDVDPVVARVAHSGPPARHRQRQAELLLL